MSGNTDFFSNMPCCRYLLNRVEHKEEAYSFTKFVVQTLHSLSFSDEDIEGAFAILCMRFSPDHPLKSHDFCSWPNGKDGVGFVQNVLLDETVPSYKHCYDFYKKYDKSTKACRLCSLSSRYVNAKKKYEEVVLRFALVSQENFDYVVSKGIELSSFSSVFDVNTTIAAASRPFLFSLCYIVFDFLSRHGADVYVLDTDKKKELITSHVRDVFHGQYSRADAIHSSLAENVCLVVMEQLLFDGECPSVDEVNSAILSIALPVEKKTEDKTVIGVSNLGESKLDGFYEDSSYVAESVPETTGVFDGLESVCYEEEVKEESSIDECVGTKDGSAEEKEPSGVVVFEPESNERFYRENGKNDNTEEDNLSYRELGYVYSTSSILFDNSTNKDGFMGIPIVCKAELDHFSLSLDKNPSRLLSLFESHVLRDKRLCIELVVLEDKKTYYLLMYSPKLHAYFHTDMRDDYIKSVLSSILTYPSIEKFCYYPYYVMSYLMKKNIYAKGVLSLFSLSAILFGKHNMLIGECLESMGCFKAEGGVHIKPEGTITALPLLYMHCYCQAYQKANRQLVSKGLLKEFEERNCFDVLLGRFYYQDLYAKKSISLFSLRDSVGYHFFNEENVTYKEKGFLLTYRFRHLPLTMAQLIRQLLCRMELKGYFKKYRTMITSVQANSFTIYTLKEDMKKIDTTINTSIVMFLREQDLYGLEYSLEKKIV